MTHRPEDSLQANELADIAAWTQFIRSRGQQLLDLYLYVSSDNYHGATKSTWTKLLPWYLKFIIPPSQRRRAKNRTVHLGMSGLDSDEVEKAQSESSEGMINHGGSSSSSAVLINQQRRLRNLLRQPEYVDSFKLNALIDQFCSPLEEQIGMKKWLVTDGEEPTSADCVLTGYLMVMRYADMPKRWLANALEKRDHKLGAWEERIQMELTRRLDGAKVTSVERPVSLHGLAFVSNHLLKSIPAFDRAEIVRMSGSVAALERQQRSKSIFKRFKILQVLSITVSALGITGLSVLGYLQWHSKREGDYVIRATQNNLTLADFGEAGEFLSIFGAQLAFGGMGEAEREHTRQAEALGGTEQHNVHVTEPISVAEVPVDVD